MSNTFKTLFTESGKTLDDYKVEVYKWLKKKRKIIATYSDADFDANEIIKYNDEINIHLNTKSFNSPVYDLEWR